MSDAHSSEQDDSTDERSDGSATGTSSMGLDADAEPDEGTVAQIEEERQRRLDPDNRPEGAEVDNTERDFDVERGRFTDSEAYDESEPAPFSDPEDPNNRESEARSAHEPDQSGDGSGDRSGDRSGDGSGTGTERQEAP